MECAEIIELISVVILLITAIFIWIQVCEMRRSTYATAFKCAYDILQNDDIRKMRKIVFSRKEKKPTKKWTPEEIHAAEKVCSSYDAVGIMVRHNMLPVDVIADSWGDSIRKLFPILLPLIMQYRVERNSLEYWNDFEWLAHQTERFHKSIY